MGQGLLLQDLRTARVCRRCVNARRVQVKWSCTLRTASNVQLRQVPAEHLGSGRDEHKALGLKNLLIVASSTCTSQRCDSCCHAVYYSAGTGVAHTLRIECRAAHAGCVLYVGIT